jgi:peptidoglycan/LPS O-acetylase OafA/YrhL
MLSHPGLVWLGDISFALYMCHQIIMKWVKIQEIEGKMALPPAWLVIVGCIAAAALLHHAVERPAQNGLKRLGRRWSASHRTPAG